MNKMQVLFVQLTGHVLAAFTRTADPEGKAKVSDLTGTGLPIRNRQNVFASSSAAVETLMVPPDALDLAVVDFDPDVFSEPLGFVAGGGRVAKLGFDKPQMDVTSPPPPPTATSSSQPPVLTPPGSPPRVNFSAARVTVELDGDTTDDKGVCVVLQEADPSPGNEPERRIALGAVPSAKHFISLDLKTSPEGAAASIPDKDFLVMALIAGYRPLFAKRRPA